MELKAPSPDVSEARLTRPQRLALTVAACVLTTLAATPLLGYLDLANIVMLFLLTVLVVAVKLGRNAAILASVLSVLFFDLFFVPPRFSLAVSNIQYLVTFIVMLVTALTTTHFTSVLRQKASEAELREQRTRALYQLARQLAGSLTTAQAIDITRDFLHAQLAAQSIVLLPDETRHRLVAAAHDGDLRVEEHLARVALESGTLVRSDEVGGMGYASLYLPLRASLRIRGVLAVGFHGNPTEPTPETLSLLEALASLLAVALERLHYVEVAQASEVRMLTERLRSSILSALSHDLRTPLTAMVGLADSLFLIKPGLPPAALETAQALHEQAARLAGLVANLLDMARLNAGEVTLRREWQPLEEVVGASIKLLGNALAEHPVKVELAKDLPLLQFDAVLVERVFCNLLENAAKYAPPHTAIELQAERQGDVVSIAVMDRGPGFPPERRDELFNMFVRGHSESGKPGTGLGLAICKAIVEAHGGRIQADDRAGGGACVSFSLPVGNPPIVEEEAA
ncbi:MAG TPA: ATP-binding protein [Azonexus sp.]|nr:ATP-binding protein [Azonexus sp.]